MATTGSALDAVRFTLDRTSPVPLHHQLARQLEEAIEQGTLAPGNLLGNEVGLSARLGLSRPTVRRPSSPWSARACWCAAAGSAPRSCTARSGARWN